MYIYMSLIYLYITCISIYHVLAPLSDEAVTLPMCLSDAEMFVAEGILRLAFAAVPRPATLAPREVEDEAAEAQQSSFVFPPDANEPNVKTNKMLLKNRSALMATLTLGGRDAKSFSVSNPLASKLSLASKLANRNPAASFFV